MKTWLKAGLRGSEGVAPKKRSTLIEKETKIIKVIYETEGLWDIEVPQADSTFEEIQIPNIGQTLEPGEPSVPQEGLYVAIPDDSDILNIEVVSTKKKTFQLKYQMKPAPQPTTDPSGKPEFIPKQEIYDLDDAYPGILFKNLGPTELGDVQVLHLMMYPIQYYPASNIIELFKKIELEIAYEVSEAPRSPLRGGPPTRGGRVRKRVPVGYEDQILNFDNI